MILGLGSDLAEVARIRASRERFGDRFLLRVYTETEIAYAFSKANIDERLAAQGSFRRSRIFARGRHGNRWDLRRVHERVAVGRRTMMGG